MGKVIMSGIVPQLKVPSIYKANFADNDWATIIKACQMNAVPGTWEVGDQKTMTINGTDYTIDIIGKNHDTYADGSSNKAPLTFQMHDLYESLYEMELTGTNANGWAGCAMRQTYLPAILKLMPVEVRAGITPVLKYTSAGNLNAGIGSSSDKLFLLSEKELCGDNYKYSFDGEGTQYDYYKAGNSTIKNLDGVGSYAWFTRSPNKSNQSYFVLADTSGGTGNASANLSRGVAFAFCF